MKPSIHAAGLLVAGLLVGCPDRASAGLDPTAPARIWLSDCNLNPDPEAPTIQAVVGTPRRLFLWAQPEIDNGGTFKKLTNFSLNLVAEAGVDPAVDLLDPASVPPRSIQVFNPQVSGKPRFEFVSDSTVGTGAIESESDQAEVLAGIEDAIEGIGGFSINAAANGIGPSCSPDDLYCDSGASGDAWLLGTVSFNAVDAVMSDLRLEIGSNGISHMGDESTANTDVNFGLDAVNYNGANDRDTQRFDDNLVEATIDAVAAAVPTVWTGGSGDWASASWSNSVTTPTAIHDVTLVGMDGDTLSVVDCQSADNTTVSRGRLHVSDGAALASRLAVDTNGVVSGGGWITDDLNLSFGGTFAIDAVETLKVMGHATVLFGNLALTENYTQAPGTITAPFDIILADDVVGTFTTASGEYLGQGIFLASITHSGDSVSVQLRNLPGDYDGDGNVDADDYAEWKGAFGTVGNHPADGNLDGVVNAADYAVWLQNLGAVATVLGVGTGAGSTIPEPASGAILLVALATCCWRRTPRKRVSGE